MASSVESTAILPAMIINKIKSSEAGFDSLETTTAPDTSLQNVDPVTYNQSLYSRISEPDSGVEIPPGLDGRADEPAWFTGNNSEVFNIANAGNQHYSVPHLPQMHHPSMALEANGAVMYNVGYYYNIGGPTGVVEAHGHEPVAPNAAKSAPNYTIFPLQQSVPSVILNPFAIPDNCFESEQPKTTVKTSTDNNERLKELVEASKRRAEIQSNIVKTIYNSNANTKDRKAEKVSEITSKSSALKHEITALDSANSLLSSLLKVNPTKNTPVDGSDNNVCEFPKNHSASKVANEIINYSKNSIPQLRNLSSGNGNKIIHSSSSRELNLGGTRNDTQESGKDNSDSSHKKTLNSNNRKKPTASTSGESPSHRRSHKSRLHSRDHSLSSSSSRNSGNRSRYTLEPSEDSDSGSHYRHYSRRSRSKYHKSPHSHGTHRRSRNHSRYTEPRSKLSPLEKHKKIESSGVKPRTSHKHRSSGNSSSIYKDGHRSKSRS